MNWRIQYRRLAVRVSLFRVSTMGSKWASGPLAYIARHDPTRISSSGDAGGNLETRDCPYASTLIRYAVTRRWNGYSHDSTVTRPQQPSDYDDLYARFGGDQAGDQPI